MGPHHQHLIGQWKEGRPRKSGLLLGQTRSHRADESRRIGDSHRWDHGQRDLPGLIDTPFIQNQVADLAAMPGFTTDEVLEQIYLPLVPQKRMLDPGEVATMVRYLASDEGRGVTGQAINVSAGWIMH